MCTSDDVGDVRQAIRPTLQACTHAQEQTNVLLRCTLVDLSLCARSIITHNIFGEIQLRQQGVTIDHHSTAQSSAMPVSQFDIVVNGAWDCHQCPKVNNYGLIASTTSAAFLAECSRMVGGQIIGLEIIVTAR